MDCLLALLCIDRSWYHPIPVLPVLWDHQVPYFNMHEEPGRPGIVDLVGLHEWIVLAGHRRLIVGRTQNVIATYPTHAVLSVHSSASDQMLDIGEVHVSIPYTALTPWLRRYISLRRWFRADLKDREFATLPGTPVQIFQTVITLTSAIPTKRTSRQRHRTEPPAVPSTAATISRRQAHRPSEPARPQRTRQLHSPRVLARRGIVRRSTSRLPSHLPTRK